MMMWKSLRSLVRMFISGPKVADDLIYLLRHAEGYQCHEGLQGLRGKAASGKAA